MHLFHQAENWLSENVVESSNLTFTIFINHKDADVQVFLTIDPSYMNKI